MKRHLCALSFAVGLLAAWQTQAMPTAGTFVLSPPGSWAEFLQDGQAGKVGNEITAAGDHYKFDGAKIASVVADPSGVWDWITVYAGGTLTLENVAGAPWFSPCESAKEFVVNFESVKVHTRSTRYTDGTLEFELKGMAGGVSITGTYSGKPKVTVVDGGVLVADNLKSAQIQVMVIPVEIKGGSPRSPLNVKSKGVLPVAILGTSLTSVRNLDPASIRITTKFGSVAPLRWNLANVPDDEGNLDRCPDLDLKFSTEAVVGILGMVRDQQVVTLTITAKLKDGTPVSGRDQVFILKKGK